MTDKILTLSYEVRDLTSVAKGVVAHGVNCLGVMGSGVALSVREVWPRVFDDYRKAYELIVEKDLDPGLQLGEAQIICVDNGAPLYVCNVFTQVNFGSEKMQYAHSKAIFTGMLKVLAFAVSQGNLPVYIPKIGAGLGGLPWSESASQILAANCIHPDIHIIVCVLSEAEIGNNG